MMLPPCSMWLQISPSGRRGHRIWLPLFLLWLLLLPLLLLLLVVAILADVVLFVVGRTYHHYTLLVLRSAALVVDTRGIVVRVKDKDAIVDVTIQ